MTASTVTADIDRVQTAATAAGYDTRNTPVVPLRDVVDDTRFVVVDNRELFTLNSDNEPEPTGRWLTPDSELAETPRSPLRCGWFTIETGHLEAFPDNSFVATCGWSSVAVFWPHRRGVVEQLFSEPDRKAVSITRVWYTFGDDRYRTVTTEYGGTPGRVGAADDTGNLVSRYNLDSIIRVAARSRAENDGTITERSATAELREQFIRTRCTALDAFDLITTPLHSDDWHDLPVVTL